MSDLIDVVMPVYNAAPYLRKSIESILYQTFSDFKFIIIDDGSSDGSREVLQHYAAQDKRIILLRNDKNSGICVSLNKAIAAGSSKYIVRMDADDISYPNRISIQLDFMEQNPDVGVCGCDVRCIDIQGEGDFIKTYAANDLKIRRQLFFFNPISHPGSIFRREVFDKTKGYNNDYILAEDLELWFAMGTYSHFANIPQTLIDYRVYTTNSTHSKFKKMIKNAIKARLYAIQAYGYKPGFLGWFVICLSFGMQFIPSYIVDRLFYKLRSLIA